MKESMEYVKRMKNLRNKLEKRMQEHQAENITKEVFDLMKKIFGNKSQEDLIFEFEKEMIKKGRATERMLLVVKDIAKLKMKVKGKGIPQNEMQRHVRDSSDLIALLTEYAQRKELVSTEKGIAKINFQNGWAELVATHKGIFVVMQNGEVRKYDKERIVTSDRQEFENALKETKESTQFNLPSYVVAAIKKEFGEFTLSF